MKIRLLIRAIVAVFFAVIWVSAQGGLQVDNSSIGGTVVNAASGKAEAGVWVIAETKLAVPYSFSETKLGYLNHIQYRPNPLAN